MSVYFILIAQISFYTLSKEYRIGITFLLLFSFVLKILFGFITNTNAFKALSHLDRLSEYDATNYYLQSVYDIATQNTLIPELHWSIADPGFSILLYWIGKIYVFFFDKYNISYFHYIYFLIFMHTLIFLFIFNYLEKDQKLSKSLLVVFSLFVLFEPSMLRFSFSLEREILVSFFLLVFITAFMDNKKIVMIISAFLLIQFRDAYSYLLPTIMLSYFIFKRYFRTKRFLFLPILLIGFSLLVFILASNVQAFEWLFFRHGKELGSSGFGDLILSSNYFTRVTIYSVLGFVAPIPVYPFFNNDYSTFYLLGLILGLSSFSYALLNSYIIFSFYQMDSLKSQYSQSTYNWHVSSYKAYIVLFILHLAFHGLIFNIRHRLQIIPGLIFVFLFIVNSQQVSGMKTNLEKCFFASILVVVFINILYFSLKIFL